MRKSLRWIKKLNYFSTFRFTTMENVTLKKIAEVLGLSISTVSRALKDHPDISQQTKLKVRELSNTLDYEPNANAINLRTRNNNIFGLMIPTANNSFYNSFLSALEFESRQKGYSLIIMQSSDDPEIEKNILKLFRQNRVAGVFACITPNTKELEAYKKMNDLSIPVVFYDKVPDMDSYRVSVDDESAAWTAIQELLNAGKKNILAIFGNKNMSITKNRMRAFNDVLLKNRGVACRFEHANNSEEATQIALRHFQADERPDAVFCMSDEILIGTMKAVQESTISYPDQIGIITISDGMIPNFYYPNITYVQTSGHKLGKKAFECMLARINEKDVEKINLVEAELFSGGSL